MPSLSSVLEDLQALADGSVDQMGKDLARAIRQFALSLDEFLLTREEWDAYSWDLMLGQIEKAIRDAGLGGQAFAEKFHSAAVGFAKGIDRGLSVVDLGKDEATALQAALGLKMTDWADHQVPGEIVAWLRGQIASATVAPVPAATLREGILEQVDTWESWAQTWVRTATENQLRETWLMAGRNAGAETYHYEGPDDLITRPFCRDLLGKGGRYTLEEIQAMDNGHGVPVLECGGGWNCRHMWVPDI